MSKAKVIALSCFLIMFSFSCKEKENNNSHDTFIERLECVSDSIQVDEIVVLNLFKSQILAHMAGTFDSLMIIEKVYIPHRELWNNCYGMIFGEENASKFNTSHGMVEWNRRLYPQNQDFFDQRATELMAINLDSVLESTLKKFSKLTPFKPRARISILFAPLQGIGFGGCTSEEFCFELNNREYDVAYTVEKGIPHELNHFAYEPLRAYDPDQGTALFLTIDEGFACYFTWLFFDGQISLHEAVENMSKEDWNWYLENEKRIFDTLKPYFSDKSGDNPLLRNDNYALFPEAPKTLYYWLGFRIVQSYIRTFGEDAWMDIYNMNVREVLEKSKYEFYLQDPSPAPGASG